MRSLLPCEQALESKGCPVNDRSANQGAWEGYVLRPARLDGVNRKRRAVGAGHARPLQANSDYNVAAIYFQTYYIFCEQTLHNM